VFSSYFDTYYQICKQNKFYPCILVGVLSGDIVIILNLFCKGIPNYVLLFND
jgi:hypothetical protein